MDSKSLFPNNGKYEIISLPKIIGSYSGAIIFSRDKDFKTYIRTLQKENKSLGQHQSYIKNKSMRQESNNFETWSENEMNNTCLEKNALNNILENLKNYDINKKIIQSRVDKVAKHLSIDIDMNQRLGPVFPIPLSHYSSSSDQIMIRNYCFSKYQEDEDFQEVYLVPLHFGVSDSFFDQILHSLTLR